MASKTGFLLLGNSDNTDVSSQLEPYGINAEKTGRDRRGIVEPKGEINAVQ